MLDESDLKLHDDVLFRAVGEEGVVVDQRGPTVLVVNAVALRVLELLRGGVVVSEIAHHLAEEFDAEKKHITLDVEVFLEQLKERGLLH